MIFSCAALLIALGAFIVHAAESPSVPASRDITLKRLINDRIFDPELGLLVRVIPEDRRPLFSEIAKRAYSKISDDEHFTDANSPDANLPNTRLSFHNNTRTVPIPSDPNYCIVRVETFIENTKCSASYYFDKLGLIIVMEDGNGGQLCGWTGENQCIFMEGPNYLKAQIAKLKEHQSFAAFVDNLAICQEYQGLNLRDVLDNTDKYNVKSLNFSCLEGGRLLVYFGVKIKCADTFSIFLGQCDKKLVLKRYPN